MACSEGARAAAADALQDATEDQKRQRGRQAAECGADAEERDADHVELFASDEGRHVGAGRQDDGVGDQIRGEHPGGFVLRSPEATGDVRQCNVGDGGVEHLHKGGERNRHGDDPRIDARTPRLFHSGAVSAGRLRKLRAGKFECARCHAFLIRLYGYWPGFRDFWRKSSIL